MPLRAFLAVVAAAILSSSTVARAGENRRPPPVDPGAAAAQPGVSKNRKKPGLRIDPRFAALVEGKFSERAEAFSAALARAHELSAAARAEAARLRALPEVERSGHGDMLDWLLGCLDDLSAEEALIRGWKKGLSREADAVSGRTVDLTCSNVAGAEVLRRASAGWGVSFEMSPAARRLNGALFVTLEGAPNLEQFVEWLAADRRLICGHAGGKLVLVLPASVELAENLAKAPKEKPAAGRSP